MQNLCRTRKIFIYINIIFIWEYLQKEYGILNQDELKESIKNYSKTIIASKELISYLKELDLIEEEYTLNKNEYLIVDKYQNNIKKAIK